VTFLAADLHNFHDVFRPLPATDGRFISFEGIEGSGKTTQIRRLEASLKAQGLEVLCLREPGGTPFGEQLRQAILTQGEPLDPMAEAGLFVASRAQLLKEKILPFLHGQPRHVVLLDRYLDSTLAYQGHARGRPVAPLWAMHQFAPLNTLPHTTFFLDIDVETSLARQAARGNQKDYFEARQRDFHQRLAEGYRALAKAHSERIVTVDARRAEDLVFADLSAALRARGVL
jgi:dTMP kinase